ncbi:MAG: hypothetical protein FGM24_09440 [Candidatus Kapabacteria bacterium]|nr:hypothetical protein [Candidatus Kapabacteria bacterium]
MNRRPMLGLLLAVMVVASTVGSAQTIRPLIPKRCFTVQVNSLDPSKLYVGHWSDRLLRSDDGGQEWYVCETGDAGFTDNYLSSVLVSSADTSVIMVGGFLFDGIKRSTNSGASFERVFTDSSGANKRAWFISEAIAEDPTNPRTVYAVRGTPGLAIWRSTDLGTTWDSLSTFPGTYRACTIGIRPDSSNIILVGTAQGMIWRSDDAGRTFTTALMDGRDTIRGDAEIPKIVFSPRDPQVAYCVVAIGSTTNPGLENAGGLWKTQDGGRNWAKIAFADTSLWAVEAINRGDTDELWVGGFRLTLQPTDVRGDSLIARSTDGGLTWTKYPDFPWGVSDEGDDNRSAWVFRYDPRTQRLYMALETGFFAVDLATSVSEGATTSQPSLTVQYHDGALQVLDASPRSDDRCWTLYDISGRTIAAARIDGSVRYAVPNLAAGTYVLTWGNDRRFRTSVFGVTP